MSFLVVGGMSGLGTGWGGSITSGAASSVAVLNAKAKAATAAAKKPTKTSGFDDDDDGATANQVIGIASQVAQGYNAYQAERRAELEAQRPVIYAAAPPSSGLPPWAPWAVAGAAGFLALLAAVSSRR